ACARRTVPLARRRLVRRQAARRDAPAVRRSRGQEGMTGTRWHALRDAAALRDEAARRILESAAAAIRERGRFRLVLSGGETPVETYRALRGARTDWTAWDLWYSDERCAPPDDPARNSKMAADAWLAHVRVPPSAIHPIPAELGAARGAAADSERLRGVPAFDLVLLGVGEDGHTASLFPGVDWGAGPDAPDALPVLDAPKPPAERVSLSARRLSRARGVLFLVSGPAKRQAVD